MIRTTPDRIMGRIRRHGREWVFVPSDFADLGTRSAVDAALNRLVQKGVIRRVARGLYDFPRMGKLMGRYLPPCQLLAAEAIVRSRGGKGPFLTGAEAANSLGLSTQVPAHTVRISSFRATITLCDGCKVRIERGKKRQMKYLTSNSNAARIISGLEFLGPREAGRRVKQFYEIGGDIRYRDFYDLYKNLGNVPRWMIPFIKLLLNGYIDKNVQNIEMFLEFLLGYNYYSGEKESLEEIEGIKNPWRNS